MELLRTRLRIRDIDESLDFFRDKLGLVEIGRRNAEDGRYTLIHLAAPEEAERARYNDAPLLELSWSRDPDERVRGIDAGYLAYQVEDIYWICQYLMQQGVTIVRPPRDGRVARVVSPEGHRVELRQQGNPREPMEPWASMEDADPRLSDQAAPEDAAIC